MAIKNISSQGLREAGFQNDSDFLTNLKGAKQQDAQSSFMDLLKNGIQEVNDASKDADKKSMDLASGKSSNIHETMLAVTKAELGFDMMVQMRNKAIESYQEVMRMQI